MSSRWKKVLADFWGNKSRTFLIIITIAVGVLAVGFNTNLGLYMAESMDGDYLSASPSEATVYAGPLDDGIDVRRVRVETLRYQSGDRRFAGSRKPDQDEMPLHPTGAPWSSWSHR